MRRLERRLQELLKKYEPQVARAFIAAIKDITRGAKLRALVRAIERNDIEAALAAIDFDRAAFAALAGGLTEAYSAGGAIVVGSTAWRGPSGQRLVVRWDMQNPRALEHIRSISSQLITILTNEAKDVVRNTIAAGYELGRGPNQIAIDLIGRVSGAQRTGGVVGLSRPQQKYVANMRRYLMEGDTSAYLGLTRRDKRFDATVLKGEPLTRAQIDRITQRYSDRLLQTRAEAIARTETAQAVEASKVEAFAQYVDKAGVPPEAIIRRWMHPGGKNSRDWHAAMNGMEVRGLTQPFVTPRGALMMHPLDTSLGAGPVEIVNCRCQQVISIDYKMLRDQ